MIKGHNEDHSVEFYGIMKSVPRLLSTFSITAYVIMAVMLFMGLTFIKYPEERAFAIQLTTVDQENTGFYDVDLQFDQKPPAILVGQSVIIKIRDNPETPKLQAKVHRISKSPLEHRLSIRIKSRTKKDNYKGTPGFLVILDNSTTLFKKLISKKI